jgi:PhoH-like ATPase
MNPHDVDLLPDFSGQKSDNQILQIALSLTKKDEKIDYLFSSGQIEIDSFIRGCSLSQQYIIIDDAQNLTPHEIKTITSRAGNGTKIVLTGDPYQIDNPYLDMSSNGLSYLVERFKGQEIFEHITFSKSERTFSCFIFRAIVVKINEA